VEKAILLSARTSTIAGLCHAPVPSLYPAVIAPIRSTRGRLMRSIGHIEIEPTGDRHNLVEGCNSNRMSAGLSSEKRRNAAPDKAVMAHLSEFERRCCMSGFLEPISSVAQAARTSNDAAFRSQGANFSEKTVRKVALAAKSALPAPCHPVSGSDTRYLRRMKGVEPPS
jgi:hypothetical protein